MNDSQDGRGASWGDYDNDGDLDLYLSTLRFGPNRLYRNNGDGTFTDVGATAGVDDTGDSYGASWGDYDHDGDLDLYVPNTTTANRLYRNEGNGTFTEVGASAGVNESGLSLGVAWGDYDDDGDVDLYVANNNGPNLLYRNDGTGTFTEVGASAGVNDAGAGFGATWGDYDHDGDLDVYVANEGSPNRLYRNNGNGTFTDVSASAGINDPGNAHGIAWGDYDNDGNLDLYVANANQPNRLYHNNEDGTFTDLAPSLGLNDSGPGHGVAWGDYDQDGDLDLYVTNAEVGPNLLYQNNGTPNRWLIVKLVGILSNRSGIGARVLAVTGAQRQRRDVDGGSGFLSQPSLPVEFGFGSTATVDELIIHWPSGIVQTLINVATNQILTVTEPSSMPDVAATPTMLDFGTVLVQESRSETLTIKNLGDADLTVTAMTHTNPAFSVNTPFTVAPSDSHAVVVTFQPSTVGTARDTLVIQSNDPDTPTLRIPLVGVGHPGPFSLSVDDVSAAPGSLALVRLRLRNARVATSGMQFVLYADPTLLRPEPNALILHTRAAGLTASSVYDSTTGELRVILFSLSNAVIDTGSASILDIPYTLNAAASIGGMTLLDLRMTTQDGSFATAFSDPTGARAITPFDLIDGSLRFGFRGDVNFDRIVNILDVVQAVQVILGIAALDPARALFFDVNTDGTINILDIVGMVHLILYGPQPKRVAAAPTSLAEVSLADAIPQDGRCVMPVHIRTTGTAAGVQMTVHTDSPVVRLLPPILADRAAGFTLASHTTEGTTTLLLYSPTGAAIPAGDSPLLFLPVEWRPDASGEATLTITHALIADHRAQAVPTQISTRSVKIAAPPTAFALTPNRPNPFNPTTQIAYDVPQQAHVTLVLYNLLGQEVVRLVDEPKMPGRYVVTWEGRNAQGVQVASGVYLYRLTSSTGFSQTKRMTLLR